MTENRGKAEHEQELMNSLLNSLYENHCEEAQALVTAGLNQIDSIECQLTPVVATKSIARRENVLLPRWLAVGLATSALILITFSISLLEPSSSATAAVVRSLDQAMADVGRHYAIRSKLRLNGEFVSRESDLFVKGADQFAIRTKGLLGVSDIWLGGNSEKGWVVTPIGPVIEGKKTNLFAWAQKRNAEISTPYLHITTVLERIRDLYDLEILENETIRSGGLDVNCQHLAAILKGQPSDQTPDRFELWINAETGVAQKVLANWELIGNQSGRDTVVIEWQSEKEIPDSFFTPETHEGSRIRPRIKFEKE